MDRVTEAYAQVYGWKVNEEQDIEPPYSSYPLPDFVTDRIKWLIDERHANEGMLTFRRMFSMLLDIDKNEDNLKEEWEWGALSDYRPFTKEYKEWLDDPILSDIRRVAVIIATVYWKGEKDEQNTFKTREHHNRRL